MTPEPRAGEGVPVMDATPRDTAACRQCRGTLLRTAGEAWVHGADWDWCGIPQPLDEEDAHGTGEPYVPPFENEVKSRGAVMCEACLRGDRPAGPDSS